MKQAIRGDLGSRLKQHLHDVLSIDVETRRWDGQGTLPAYLRDAYAFIASTVLGVPCLFLLDRGAQRSTPSAIRKQLAEVSKRGRGDVVYVAAAVDSARRKQLIDQHVPFVVPGNQVYLPMAGIDLREHFKKVKGAAEKIGPAAQAVLLHVIYHPDVDRFSPRELASALGYTPMSMTRALDELEASGVGLHINQGKRRFLEVVAVRRELWEQVRPMLRSPVMRRVVVTGLDRDAAMLSAGLSALASCTNLAEPGRPVVAIGRRRWSRIAEQSRRLAPEDEDPSSFEVEVWSYPPGALTKGRIVDRLSLYLSLVGSTDERVESALDEALGGMRW
jgi:DNA-binding MarR family transcriptional regulator